MTSAFCTKISISHFKCVLGNLTDFSTENSNSTTENLYYYRQGHQRETRSVSPVVYYFGDLLPIGLWLIHLLRFRWPGFGFRTHDGSLVKS